MIFCPYGSILFGGDICSSAQPDTLDVEITVRLPAMILEIPSIYVFRIYRSVSCNSYSPMNVANCRYRNYAHTMTYMHAEWERISKW